MTFAFSYVAFEETPNKTDRGANRPVGSRATKKLAYLAASNVGAKDFDVLIEKHRQTNCILGYQ